jgi:hypothetical protein
VAIRYRKFDQATVTDLWWLLLTRARRLGWKGKLTGPRSGSRTYLVQKALWLLFLSGRGAPAFNPDAPDPQHKRRHMRATIRLLGAWAQAVDVTDPEGLIRAAKRQRVALHRPYNPPEFWHVQAVKVFKLVTSTAAKKANDKKLLALMKAHGVVNPAQTLKATRATGLPLHYACAMLWKESLGGQNVFGHDPTASIPRSWMGKTVTKARYVVYKKNRKAGLGMQGVGPTQLTWYAFQDRADALGGCWNPYANMLVGFAVLRANIKLHGPQKGAARYNGSGPMADRYGRDFIVKANRWKAWLAPALL